MRPNLELGDLLFSVFFATLEWRCGRVDRHNRRAQFHPSPDLTKDHRSVQPASLKTSCPVVIDPLNNEACQLPLRRLYQKLGFLRIRRSVSFRGRCIPSKTARHAIKMDQERRIISWSVLDEWPLSISALFWHATSDHIQ